MTTERKPVLRIRKGRAVTSADAVDALLRAERRIGAARRKLEPGVGAALGGGILDRLRTELAELRHDLATGAREVRGGRVVKGRR